MKNSIKCAKYAVDKKMFDNVIITGDFNYSTITWDEDGCSAPGGDSNIANKFIDCLDDCFLKQHVKSIAINKLIIRLI